MLALLLAGFLVPTLLADDALVVVSDDFTAVDPPAWYDQTETSEIIPAQFQARSRSAGGGSRTSTRQAALSGNGRSAQIGQLRLANTPKMMGDFFNLPGHSATVGELFTDGGEHDGLAVHQASGSGSAFAADNIALIVTDSMTQKVVFLGGPGGVTPRSYFEPSIPASELQNPQTGLSLVDDYHEMSYTAVLTGDTTDVFDNPSDDDPSIPDAPVYQVFQVTEMAIAGPNAGDIVGRVRVQDNNNAMPTDRVFCDYNYFHNVPFTANGIDVNRFVPGIEKTFLDGIGSVEVRVPMAVSFNSTQFVDVGPDSSNTEFGNLTVIPKILLTSNDEMALATGMGIALPTADDVRVYGQTGAQILGVDNDSVHLVPFLGYMFVPRRGDCFFISFLTVDVDTNGNSVNADTGTGSLTEIGRWNDQTLLSASGSFGKYLYQNYSRNSVVKDFSLLGELHYTATVNDADTINSGPFLLGNADYDLSLLNTTVGANVRFSNSTLTTGYTVPLTSSDRIFDGELRVFINRFF